MLITISREFGAGGSLVAAHAARALGWRLVDNDFVTQVAARAGLPKATVAAREERVPAAVEAESDDSASMLRSQDGETSHAPAFLSAPSAAPAAEPEAKRTRTRTRRKPAEFANEGGGEGEA